MITHCNVRINPIKGANHKVMTWKVGNATNEEQACVMAALHYIKSMGEFTSFEFSKRGMLLATSASGTEILVQITFENKNGE